MPINKYIKDVNKQLKTGIAREHAYRPALKVLLEELCPAITATNDPARIDCGAPDFILSKSQIGVGYIEAKDIGVDLDQVESDEQLTRYRKSLENLILTDYLEFRLYVQGERVGKIQIGSSDGSKVQPHPEQFEDFHDLIVNFCQFAGQTIKSPSTLAKMMAAKSRLMARVLTAALEADVANDENTELHQQLKAFRTVLMHELEPRDFAGIYAQTIAYGMFAARLHDTTLDSFSRQEAANLIPKTNPFLRKLFHNIAGPDLDIRIDWIVEALVEIFRATDVAGLLAEFGASTQKSDPFIHFYETFLAEYDAQLRRSRGVWYTPEPVVHFIVDAVDTILVNEFGLDDGLADSSKTTIRVHSFREDKRTKSGTKFEEKEVHRVQILDPATGTGTFLVNVVNQIYEKFDGQQGIWPEYVTSNLVPRVHGFEILMASYAVAHLKLERRLAETGYQIDSNKRLHVYLTNSLEEHHPDTGTLFSTWLSTEASEANLVKRDTPVMVVLGNPPYSTSSTNKGEWILDLVGDYKKDLNERNVNALSDDYVKFFRFGQFLVDRTGEGILAYVSNNSFLDGVTHRRMRQELLRSFDSIYILNLHGDSNKGEKAPDGSPDQNVFDIKQGVAITVLVKNGSKDGELSQLYHCDLYGSRASKYQYLLEHSIADVEFQRLETNEPYFWFIPKVGDGDEVYRAGFGIDELFKSFGSGIKFRKDSLLVVPHDSEKSVKRLVSDIATYEPEDLMTKYSFKETKDFKISEQRKYFKECSDRDIVKVQYRPFDFKYTFYPEDRISKIIPRGDSRKQLMTNMLRGENLALLSGRQNKSGTVDSYFVTNLPSEMKCAERTIQSYHFPLYIYPEQNEQEGLLEQPLREPNLNDEIVSVLASRLGVPFEKEQGTSESFSPIDILDYIYATLYSQNYRERYKDQLKSSFPRIPYPRDNEYFRKLADKGRTLRELHLLSDPRCNEFVTTYPSEGTNRVTRKITSRDFELTSTDVGRVWINDNQFFDGVPVSVWEFTVGGYEPAQKWLKDRRGQTLSFDQICHYQRIIASLALTIKTMVEIDEVFEAT